MSLLTAPGRLERRHADAESLLGQRDAAVLREIAHGCDCGSELQWLADAAGGFRKTPGRERFPAWLTALKQTSGEK